MATQGRAKTLRVGFLSGARNLKPWTAHDVESSFVLRHVFEAPFGITYGTTEVAPKLFKGPLRPVGANSLAAELAEDLRFSDGSPVTAEDVVRCLGEATLVQQQASARADGRRVVFDLKRPNPRLDLTLSHLQCCVYRNVGQQTLGSGPYQIEADASESLVRLTRNPHHRRQPAIEEIQFRTCPPDADGRPSALLRAIEGGELDLTLSLGRDDMDAVSAASGATKVIQPGLSTAILFFNCESPRLRDARMRQAIAHSVNRIEIAATSYTNPLAFIATSLTPRALARTEDALTFNLVKARALLAEAGPLPEKLDMLAVWGPRPYLPYPQKVFKVIGEQLKSIGIQVQVRQAASVDEYRQATRAGTQDLTLAGWVADVVDPCDFLEALLRSDRVPAADNFSVAANHGHLRSPAMDAALDRYRADRSAESLAGVVTRLNESAPLIPLMHGSAATVRSARVMRMKPSPLWYVPVEELDLKV